MVGLPLSLVGPATAQPVEFMGAKGMRLVGEYGVPNQGGVRPAVLLLPGSGPTDRDGNQPAFQANLLKDLAAILNEEGFVTLRFDKRAVGRPSYTSQWPKTAEAIGEFFRFENFEGDVLAAYRRLRFHPRVDPNRVLILGHSEGGILAISVAKRAKPAGLMLLGTPGRSMGDLLIEQIDAAMTRQKVPEPMATQIKENNRAIVASYRKGEAYKGEVHPGLRALYNPSVAHYLKRAIPLDPSHELRGFAGPVYLANGESDVQVHPVRDMGPLQKAASHAKAFVAPSASHNFKRVADPNKELGIAGPIEPGFVNSLRTWLRGLWK